MTIANKTQKDWRESHNNNNNNNNNNINNNNNSNNNNNNNNNSNNSVRHPWNSSRIEESAVSLSCGK